MRRKTEKSEREAALALRAQSGDVEACGKLVQQYMPMMYRTAMAYANSRHSECDLVQDCAVVLMHRKMQAFNPSKSCFCTWIHYQIRAAIAHAATDRTRVPRKRHLAGAIVMSQVGTDGAFFDSAEAVSDPWLEEAPVVIERLLPYLPPRHRQVVELRAAGQSLDRIGEQMGICKERVRQLLSASFQKIRQRFPTIEDFYDKVEVA